MADDIKPRKIMTKPLPQILDEIEESIGLAEGAAKIAREAAGEARKAGEKAAKEAAIEVRKAAEKSIEETTKIMSERISKVEATVNERVSKVEATLNERIALVEKATNEHLAAVEQLADLLKSAMLEGITVVEDRISGKTQKELGSNPKSGGRKTERP